MGLNCPGFKWTACLLHIVQYSADATVTRAGGLGVVGGIDAIVVAVEVLVVGTDTSIAAFHSGKCPFNNLTLFCFLSDFLSCFSFLDSLPFFSWEFGTL